MQIMITIEGAKVHNPKLEAQGMETGTLPAPGNEFLELTPCSFRFNIHTTVRQIPDKSLNVINTGYVLGRIPESYTLNSSGYRYIIMEYFRDYWILNLIRPKFVLSKANNSLKIEKR